MELGALGLAHLRALAALVGQQQLLGAQHQRQLQLDPGPDVGGDARGQPLGQGGDGAALAGLREPAGAQLDQHGGMALVVVLQPVVRGRPALGEDHQQGQRDQHHGRDHRQHRLPGQVVEGRMDGDRHNEARQEHPGIEPRVAALPVRQMLGELVGDHREQRRGSAVHHRRTEAAHYPDAEVGLREEHQQVAVLEHREPGADGEAGDGSVQLEAHPVQRERP